jgi:hypothetical protein
LAEERAKLARLVDHARGKLDIFSEKCKTDLQAKIDEATVDSNAAELAPLAVDVYDPKGPVLDWDCVKTFPGDSGFFAALYKNRQDGRCVLAFRGTRPTSLEDLNTDRSQAALKEGEAPPEAYLEAMRTAQETADSIGKECGCSKPLEFVGHSLGGGEALASSAVTGGKATTFNPAALNPATVGADAMKKLNADNFVVAGEELETIEVDKGVAIALGAAVDGARYAMGDSLLPSTAFTALGATAPSPVGNEHRLPSTQLQRLKTRAPLLHQMANVVVSLKEQLQREQIEIRSIIGRCQPEGSDSD